MFGRSSKETTTVSEYIEKKSKLIKKKNKIFRAKIDYALRGEHRHYFSKQDVMALDKNARCKICGILLSEFRVQHRIDNWTPHLKPIHTDDHQEEKITG